MHLIQMPATMGVRSWDAAMKHADGEVRDAVLAFKALLGDNWSGWARGSPLAACFHTSFQDQPREWVRLHRLLRDLDGTPHVDGIVRHGLGKFDWAQFVAGVMTLELCAGMRRHGRPVELVQTGNEKCTDARVTLLDRSVAFEFKALQKPDAVKEWDDLMDWATFWESESPLTGLRVVCESPALEYREAFVAGLLAVKRNGGSELRDLPLGTGQAACDKDRAGWTFPVKQRDDSQRIVGNILGKWRLQLTTVDAPLILMVRTERLFGASLADSARRLSEALTRKLASIPKLSAVVVYDELMWPAARSAFLDEDGLRLAVQPAFGGVRAALFVRNPGARFPLTTAEAETVVGPAMIW